MTATLEQTPTGQTDESTQVAGEHVNIVNVRGEPLTEPERRFSEPILRFKGGRYELDYVGEPDPDGPSRNLFLEMGTPGHYFKSGLILLPTETAEYGDANQLHKTTLDFINRYCQLPDGMDTVAAYYIRLTWLYDAFSELPYLRFRAPAFGMGKSRALEVVGSLCRRATLVAGTSTSAALRRILDTSRGTLLIDEGDLDPQNPAANVLTRMLLTGFQRGRMICVSEQSSKGSWKPTGSEAFGPKIVAHHHRFSNAALESRFVDCLMEPKTRRLPLNLPQPDFDRDALAVRNQHLAFRQDYFDTVQLDPALERPELEDRTNQIAIPLLSVVDDPANRETIVKALVASQNQVKADIAASVDGILAESVLELSDDKGSVLLAHVAASVGEAVKLDTKGIGARLRMLGLEGKHTRDGNAVLIDDKCRRQLEALLRRKPSGTRSQSSPCSQSGDEHRPCPP